MRSLGEGGRDEQRRREGEGEKEGRIQGTGLSLSRTQAASSFPIPLRWPFRKHLLPPGSLISSCNWLYPDDIVWLRWRGEMDSQYESPWVLYLLLTAVFSVFQQVPRQKP